MAGLARHAAIAGPAWWDANAPARRVTYVRRAAEPLPAPPWPARRALDFCAELALALATVHEAGAAQGELRPGQRRDAARRRPTRARAVRAQAIPRTTCTASASCCSSCSPSAARHAGLVVAGEIGPAAEAATLLQGLLDPDPAARPSSARQVAARLTEIASSVPDTMPAPARPPRRSRGALAAAVVLLLVAGVAGGYLVGHRVGPPGPALSPTTVTVPTSSCGQPVTLHGLASRSAGRSRPAPGIGCGGGLGFGFFGLSGGGRRGGAAAPSGCSRTTSSP